MDKTESGIKEIQDFYLQFTLEHYFDRIVDICDLEKTHSETKLFLSPLVLF